MVASFCADGSAVGGHPGPGKPPNIFPMKLSSSPDRMDAAALLPSVGNDLQGPGGVRRF